MSKITVRQRNQITIPKAIAEQAGISEGMVCDLVFVNGTIMIRLPEHDAPADDLMQYAGIGRGLWGQTSEDVDRTIRETRDSFDRELPA